MARFQANPGIISLSPSTIIFLIATLVTATVTFLTVSRMANQLKQVAPTERRASIFLDLPWIIREPNRLLPPRAGPCWPFDSQLFSFLFG